MAPLAALLPMCRGKRENTCPGRALSCIRSSISDREQETDRKGKGKESSGWFVIAAKQKGLVRPGQVNSTNEQGARQGHFDHSFFILKDKRKGRLS